MKLWPVLLVLLAGCGCAGLPFDGVKPATARLDLHGGVCSATYIGPATILTARHCIATDAGTFNIDGERAGYALLADDKQDHVMLRVTVRRRVWAHMGPDPRSGDQVFKRGNPLGLHDILIVGRIAGKDGKNLLISAVGYKGDSGAGVFDRRGRLVAVVSALGGRDAFYLLIAFPLEFTEKDWAAATA